MSAFIWRSFLSRSFGKRKRKGKVSASTCRKVRLHLEELEERAVPAVITVTTSADNVTVGDGQVTLREAITAHNNGSTGGNPDFDGHIIGTIGNDTIVFDSGLAGQTITLAPAYPTSQLELGGASVGSITIDGRALSSGIIINGSSGYRVFQIDSGVQAGLYGLTIQGGNVAADGGGILNYGTLSLVGNTIRNNSASNGNGGGIYNVGTLTMSGNTVSNNQASSEMLRKYGGGIYNSGTLSSSADIIQNNSASGGAGITNQAGTLTVNGDSIANNTGGGILSRQSGATLTLLNTTVTQTSDGVVNAIDASATVSNSQITGGVGNGTSGASSVRGGTLTLSDSAVDGLSNYGGTVTVNDTAISNGSGITNWGFDGEIGVYYSGVMTVNRSTIMGNTTAASDRGAGITNYASTLTISDSTISENTATGLNDAGGLYNASRPSPFTGTGMMTVTGCTISYNNAGGYGGGIYNKDGQATVTNSTIYANAADDGGGVYTGAGSLTSISNSTIYGNGATFVGAIGGIGNHGSLGLLNTIVTGNSPTNLYQSPSSGGNNLVSVDARLGPLTDNGGPTLTLAPQPGSPAIGTGGAVATLVAPIPNNSTSISVSDGNAIARTPGNYLIKIDNELMLVTNVATNILAVTRGYHGTTATAHSGGALVYLATDQREYLVVGARDIGAYQTQAISQAPVFTSASSATFPPGVFNSFTVTATGSQTTISLSDTDILPTGVTFNAGTRVLSGTPAPGTHGIYTLHFTAHSQFGETTQTFTLLVNSTPTMDSISSPQTAVHGSTPTNINLNVADADGDSITATVTLTDPIYANVSNVYGLHSAEQTQYYNYRGAREKYFVSSNGSNPAGGGYYVLMPTNKLYAWRGSMSATLAASPVVDFTSATYANVDVYSNPALMTSNTGTPLVTVGNPLYDLKVKYGLDTAAQYFNYRGANEWYLHSSNGSNPTGGGWYLLLPNNTLVAWKSSISDYTLVANLASYGSVYTTPTLLTSATPGTAVGVTASISPNPIPSTSQPGGTLTITPMAAFERSVNVTVSITDGFVATPVTQSFTYKVTNTAPIMSAIGDRTIAHNNATDSFNVSGTVSDPGDASTRVYGVEVSGYGSSYPLDQVAGQYGLNTANQYTNYRGQGETYFLSSNNSNAGNGGWYVLASDSKLYAWAGSMSATTTGATSSPYFVADFMTAFYGNQNVSADPSLLYNARKPSAPAVNVNRGPLYDVKVQYGLDTADQYYNYRGQSEKYFVSSNGSNPAGGGFYVLMPDGKLYAWDGVGLNSTTSGGSSSAFFVADLGTTNAWSNPSLLYQAQAVFVNDAIYDAKYRYGLYTADIPAYANYRGQGEKYLLSGNGSNPANGGWYVLIANGGSTELRAWNGVSLNTSPAVATFSGLSVLNNPNLLYASTGQALGVTATVDGSGQVTLTRDAAFAGSVRVAVTASDGAEQASRTFKFTVTNNAPTPPTINNVNAAGGTGATVTFATAASDADGDTLSFRASISDNPLYLLKTQYGLNTADQFFNYRLQNEKYFLSSNGSNPAGGGYYVLTTANKLYAWDGVSYNTTVAQAPVADFTSSYYGNANVYTTTSLLYSAVTTPNLSQIGTSSLTAGSMNLTWPSGFTGKFLVTFYASDGAKETERIFLVTVS